MSALLLDRASGLRQLANASGGRQNLAKGLGSNSRSQETRGKIWPMESAYYS